MCTCSESNNKMSDVKLTCCCFHFMSIKMCFCIYLLEKKNSINNICFANTEFDACFGMDIFSI